jgi:NADH dehydrogenase FAD-containing subunit
VTLLHRRADLHETMSEYLILELERYGIAVRARSEVVELHGANGELESVTLKDGERLSFSFLFLFLGASPCTDWLGDVVARDDKGFVLTGAAAGAEGLLETSVPGIYAAGDVRSESIKRCATAVGEGAMVVQFIHKRLAGPHLRSAGLAQPGLRSAGLSGEARRLCRRCHPCRRRGRPASLFAARVDRLISCSPSGRRSAARIGSRHGARISRCRRGHWGAPARGALVGVGRRRGRVARV